MFDINGWARHRMVNANNGKIHKSHQLQMKLLFISRSNKTHHWFVVLWAFCIHHSKCGGQPSILIQKPFVRLIIVWGSWMHTCALDALLIKIIKIRKDDLFLRKQTNYLANFGVHSDKYNYFGENVNISICLAVGAMLWCRMKCVHCFYYSGRYLNSY